MENINNIDPEVLKKYQIHIDAAKVEAGQQGLARMQEQVFMAQEDKGMIKEQLDLTEEITRIDYLIKGYSLEPNLGGALAWVKPANKEMIIFSDYGIHLIRNTIGWYLNKNLLLSNFDEATIRKKMWDFTNDLIDTIFMECEKVFLQPTVQDCIDTLKKRIKKSTEISCYAREVAGISYDEKEIMKEKFDELEDRIEVELEQIRQQIVKSKLKRFILIVRTIQDAIHATYMRAWKGIERSSLRQHTTISENRGMPIMMTPQKSGGIWPWSRKQQ